MSAEAGCFLHREVRVGRHGKAAARVAKDPSQLSKMFDHDCQTKQPDYVWEHLISSRVMRLVSVIIDIVAGGCYLLAQPRAAEVLELHYQHCFLHVMVSLKLGLPFGLILFGDFFGSVLVILWYLRLLLGSWLGFVASWLPGLFASQAPWLAVFFGFSVFSFFWLPGFMASGLPFLWASCLRRLPHLLILKTSQVCHLLAECF